jgi:hypothetical protein
LLTLPKDVFSTTLENTVIYHIKLNSCSIPIQNEQYVITFNNLVIPALNQMHLHVSSGRGKKDAEWEFNLLIELQGDSTYDFNSIDFRYLVITIQMHLWKFPNKLRVSCLDKISIFFFSWNKQQNVLRELFCKHAKNNKAMTLEGE